MSAKEIASYFAVGLIGGVSYELILYITSETHAADWFQVITRVAVISISMALGIAFFRSASKKDLNNS